MKFFRSLTTCMLLLLTSPAFSHTTVAEIVPRNGSVLEQSPDTVEIRFAHSARLTSAVLLGEDKQERRLEFIPSGNSDTFKFPAPDLGPGRNEIKWKALSDDGHVISGSLIYTIKPKKTEDRSQESE